MSFPVLDTWSRGEGTEPGIASEHTLLVLVVRRGSGAQEWQMRGSDTWSQHSASHRHARHRHNLQSTTSVCFLSWQCLPCAKLLSADSLDCLPGIFNLKQLFGGLCVPSCQHPAEGCARMVCALLTKCENCLCVYPVPRVGLLLLDKRDLFSISSTMTNVHDTEQLVGDFKEVPVVTVDPKYSNNFKSSVGRQ